MHFLGERMFPGNGTSSLPTTALEVPRGTSFPGGNLLGAGTPRLARSTVLGDRQDPILSISLIILVSALSRVGSPADGVELTLMSLATYLAAGGNSTRVTAHNLYGDRESHPPSGLRWAVPRARRLCRQTCVRTLVVSMRCRGLVSTRRVCVVRVVYAEGVTFGVCVVYLVRGVCVVRGT